jgi:hypothetical protein
MPTQLPYLATSLAIHGAIVLLLHLHQQPNLLAEPVEIQILEKKNGNQRGKPPGKSTGKSTTESAGKSKANGDGLGRFTPKIPIPDAGATGLNPERDALANGSSEWPEDAWGRKGGDFGEVVNFLKYDRVREDIRGLLNYPYILARRNFSGTVNVRLLFTDQSACDWKRTQITSAERHLRIYILTLLKKLCALNTIKNLNAGRNDEIDLSFQFEIINEFTPQEQQQPGDFITGNVIAFRRTAPKSVFEYQIGPVRGVWFAPAISLDFPWLVEKWDQYVNGIDPMAPFRE